MTGSWDKTLKVSIYQHQEKVLQTLFNYMIRAFFHHFGNMTHTPGIGNFRVVLPEIGNFFLHHWGIKSFKHI
jgi:hypothetical protein